MDRVRAKCRHVKRLLNANQSLSGEALEFALDILPRKSGSKYDPLFDEMASKLKSGQQLDAYEHHLMVDVLLLHVRLGAPRET